MDHFVFVCGVDPRHSNISAAYMYTYIHAHRYVYIYIHYYLYIVICINKVTPPVKTRAVLHSGISDVLQDMWHSCPKVFAIVVSVLPAVGPLPKALIDMACL